MMLSLEEPRELESWEENGKFTAYGEVADLFHWWDAGRRAPSEALVEGAAGASKTRPILEFIREYCDRYPRSKWVIMRATRASMSETVLVEWEESVLGPTHSAVLGGPTRDNRDKYTFSNGSEVILRGYDDEYKLYSGQYHGIYFNEATDLKDEKKWEKLHRALRAKVVGGQPFRPLIADCNPVHRSFWLNQRAKTKKTRRICSKLHDNPRWFDHVTWTWKPDGVDYIGRMKRNTSGPTYQSLVLGEWVLPSGAFLPEFQWGKHVIKARMEKRAGQYFLHYPQWGAQPRELKWFFGGLDWGYRDPSVIGIWGMDAQRRMYCVAEVYKTELTHPELAAIAVELGKEFRPLNALACDHKPELIKVINSAFRQAGLGETVARNADKTLGLPGDRGKRARAELLRSRLFKDEIFWLEGCNRHIDTKLKDAGLPWCTAMELEAITFEEFVRGEDRQNTQGKVDERCEDHGFDETLYACAYANDRTPPGSAKAPRSNWERYWNGERLSRAG